VETINRMGIGKLQFRCRDRIWKSKDNRRTVRIKRGGGTKNKYGEVGLGGEVQ